MLGAAAPFRRKRPSDASWPSKAAWQRLSRETGGNLVPVNFPLAACRSVPNGVACTTLFEDLRNPYYIGDTPGLTQTLGWVDAWLTAPSVYAVAARNARDVAAAVTFARKHDLRLVVKGGGHSYQGTSNAPDSLLVWTRHMNAIELHDAFVPHGCTGKARPAVTLGAGAIWLHAYEAVTTKAGLYVQGGGCATVGVAGLIQSGGFGSFSKHYGTAAASLLQAEVVTADGRIRIANACTNPDLFWALKGGGGGTFGVVTSITLRLHELPAFFGVAAFTVKAASDAAYRDLLAKFVAFYRDRLFNDRWGEQAIVHSNNALQISMVSYGVDSAHAQATWKPFLDWIGKRAERYTLAAAPVIASFPARDWWNGDLIEQLFPSAIVQNKAPGARPGEFWWAGDADQVGQFLHAYESLWLPSWLLDGDAQAQLVDALFACSRSAGVSLHFNKGLAGAPPAAIAAAKETATNPAVLSSFALAISAGGQGPAYPGIPGHEPDVAAARKTAEAVRAGMNALRAVARESGSYVSESSFFEGDWQRSYWGSNYARLAAIKKQYDPDGLFVVHHGVGSERWSLDGFTRLS